MVVNRLVPGGAILRMTPDGGMSAELLDGRVGYGVNSVEALRDAREQRRCRVCGCTDMHACDGGCYWVADDLCSACADPEFTAIAPLAPVITVNEAIRMVRAATLMPLRAAEAREIVSLLRAFQVFGHVPSLAQLMGNGAGDNRRSLLDGEV